MVDVPKPISQLNEATQLKGFLVGYDPTIPLANQRTVRFPVGIFKGDKGDTGLKGDKGEQGLKGDPGINGQGVPVGGTLGQVLTKKSGNDFDTEWKTIASGGAPSNTRQRRRFFIDFTTINRDQTKANVSFYLDQGFSLYKTATQFDLDTLTNNTIFNNYVGAARLAYSSSGGPTGSAQILHASKGFVLGTVVSKFEALTVIQAKAVLMEADYFLGVAVDAVNRNTTIGAIGFLASQTSTESNYKAVVANGSAKTVVDTGIPYVGTPGKILKVLATSSKAEFYIDGTLVATITTNIPTQSLGPIASHSVLSVSSVSGQNTSSGEFIMDYIEFIPDTTWWGIG